MVTAEILSSVRGTGEDKLILEVWLQQRYNSSVRGTGEDKLILEVWLQQRDYSSVRGTGEDKLILEVWLQQRYNSSVQFRIVFTRSGKTVCAPTRLREVSPVFPLK